MKTLLMMLAAGLISAGVWAQDPPKSPGKYCVVMKDGVRRVMLDGNVITMEVVLNDSTRLTPDGVLIRTDGARAVLRTGECVGRNGELERRKDD